MVRVSDDQNKMCNKVVSDMGVKRPLAWESQTTDLRKEEALTRLLPDWHVRRQNGSHRAYLCLDKQGVALICTQKLSLLADHINKMAGDKSETVSETALYYALTNDGTGLNGARVKYRWKVVPLTLEEAAREFNSLRPNYERATILGAKQCVQTTCA